MKLLAVDTWVLYKLALFVLQNSWITNQYSIMFAWLQLTKKSTQTIWWDKAEVYCNTHCGLDDLISKMLENQTQTKNNKKLKLSSTIRSKCHVQTFFLNLLLIFDVWWCQRINLSTNIWSNFLLMKTDRILGRENQRAITYNVICQC